MGDRRWQKTDTVNLNVNGYGEPERQYIEINHLRNDERNDRSKMNKVSVMGLEGLKHKQFV